MSSTFVGSIRSRPQTIRLAPQGAPVITVRVQMPEAWDAVRFAVSPADSAINLKRRALAALAPGAQFPEDFVLKLRGWEVLDETAPLAEIGVRDGSILLLTYRRKRPVRRGG
ncbi:MAG: hypothetical protein M3282_04270 [Gemmatimonadota bacterium]|nr:hypothetical protein [Gemmatimonadota bacterium]